MKDSAGRKLGRELLDAVRGYVARSLAQVITQVKAIEARLEQISKQAPSAGKDGRDGKDADPALIRKIVAEAMAALPAPKDGKDGKSIDREELAVIVRAALEAAPKPENGRDGAPGRDAIALDILPGIDQARSYPRGTYARHDGGIWRAAADTHGMRNWECVVAGVAALKVELRDERTMVVTTALSGAEPTVTEIKLLHPLDRGIYRPEQKYLKGDGVTFGGSWWIAQVDEPTDKPGTSDQWRLAVKRGRDGKDTK